MSPEEVRHIRSDTTATTTASVPWVRLLGFRQTWAYAVAKLLCDPVWFFYLFWLPKFLDTKYGVKLSGLALPLIVVYVVADIGSVAGGWLSSRLISRGWSINRARKTVMLVMACLIVPTAFAPLAPTMWVAILAVAVAAAAHQAWMANVFALPGDVFPRSAVGSVAGIGSFAGAMAGVVFQRSIGRILDANGGDYTPIFAACGGAYLVALTLVHLLIPRWQLAPMASPPAALATSPAASA